MFFVVTVALIGLIQYAIHELPHGKDSDPQSTHPPTVRRGFACLLARNETTSTSTASTSTGSSSSQVSQVSTTGIGDVSFVVFTPTPSTSSSISSSTNSSTSGSSSLIVSASSAAETDYVAEETTLTLSTTTIVSTESNLAASTASEDYVAPAVTTTITPVTYSTNQAAYVSTLVTVTLETTYGVDSVIGGETVFMSAPESDYVQTKKTTILITTTPSANLAQAEPTTVISTSFLQEGPLGAPVQSNAQPTDQTSASQNAITTTGVSGQSSTNVPSPDSAGSNLNKSTVLILRWDASQTFLGTYLPVLLAVLYRIFWAVIFNNSSLIEPFRQLVNETGSSAERAFFSFYQAQSNLLGPIPALLKRSWSLALVAAAYTVACFLPALASESVVVDTNWQCPDYLRNHTPGAKNPCRPRMAANVGILRALQGMLAFAALALLIMILLGLRYKTGLPANPSSIATVSSLMRHPALIEDLNEIPVNATPDEMKRILVGKRYRLAYYKAEHGGVEYGIVPLGGEVDVSTSARTGRGRYAPIDGASPFAESGHVSVRRLRLRDFILAFAVAGAFGVVLAYYLVGGENSFNRFFNSGSFGPRFILTGAGTVLSSMWKTVEQSKPMLSSHTHSIILADSIPRLHNNVTLPPPRPTPIKSLQHNPLHTPQHAHLLDPAHPPPRLLLRRSPHAHHSPRRTLEHRHQRRSVRSRADLVAISAFVVHLTSHPGPHAHCHRCRDCEEVLGACGAEEAGDVGCGDELFVREPDGG